MLFNVEFDDARRIGAWLVPDRPDVVPRIRVFVGEGQAASIIVSANQIREDVKAAGIHDTGICGFLIDDSVVPNIETARGLSIRDFDTGLLLYSRGGGKQFISGRHFRLETRLLPRNRVDGALQPYFHMNYPGIEQLPAQTARSVLAIPYTLSLNASGRVPMHTIDDVLRQRGFKTSVLIGDPFREIFARILLIQKGDDAARIKDLAPHNVLERIHAALRQVQGRDLAAVDDALKQLDPEAMNYLSDPLTRQLVEASPGQALPRVAAQEAALRLADFDVIGLDTDPGEYFELVGAVFSSAIKLNAAVGKGPEPALSEQLRALPSFRRLARFDGPLYDMLVETQAALPEAEEASDTPPPLLTFSSGRQGARGPAAQPASARRVK